LWRRQRRWGGVVRCGWWSSYLARPGFTSYDTCQPKNLARQVKIPS
jgi:hypothetical protein